MKLLLSGCELKNWHFSESFSACSLSSLQISSSGFILSSVGTSKTDSAFTSVLCLEKLWAVLEMDSEVFAREGSSRKAVEGPENPYLLRNLGNGLSVGGLWSTGFPPLSDTCVLDRRCEVGLHSGLTGNSWYKRPKTSFFLPGTVMG